MIKNILIKSYNTNFADFIQAIDQYSKIHLNLILSHFIFF